VGSDALNGFNSNTTLSQPLPGELYQRIHVTALKRVVRGVQSHAAPDTIDVAHLKGCLSLDGPESLLAHPADVTRIFAGVTLDTIRTIKRLYCSRLGRSIRMVWQILNAGGKTSESHTISYEAVWAICLFFEEHRRISVDINVERGKETWWLGIVSPDFTLNGPHTPSHRPAIACLVDVQTQYVLSFRIGPADILQELIELALYDALAAQRRPQRLAHTGLLWHLPQRIVTEGTLPLQYSILCRHATIAAEPATGTQPVLQAVHETWAAGLAGRTLSPSHCALLLDTYLNTMHTYSPRRTGELRDRDFGAAHGYRQDPAWQFPLLRMLLPRKEGWITDEGLITWNGLLYRGEFLHLWPGRWGTLRLSAHKPGNAWVYLDGEVLCLAQRQRGNASWKGQMGEKREKKEGKPCIS
jgi:Mu transposase, C-terminal